LFFTITPTKTGSYSGQYLKTEKGQRAAACKIQRSEPNSMRTVRRQAISLTVLSYRMSLLTFIIRMDMEDLPQPAKDPERSSSAKICLRALQLPHRIQLALRNPETHHDVK
jgi:hypothetical protein